MYMYEKKGRLSIEAFTMFKAFFFFKSFSNTIRQHKKRDNNTKLNCFWLLVTYKVFKSVKFVSKLSSRLVMRLLKRSLFVKEF